MTFWLCAVTTRALLSVHATHSSSLHTLLFCGVVYIGLLLILVLWGLTQMWRCSTEKTEFCTSTWQRAELGPVKTRVLQPFSTLGGREHVNTSKHTQHKPTTPAKPMQGYSGCMQHGFPGAEREYMVQYFLWCFFSFHFLSISGLSFYFSFLIFHASFLVSGHLCTFHNTLACLSLMCLNLWCLFSIWNLE